MKKGSKILSRSSCEIPSPVSVTRSSTSPAARSAKMSTVPPFGMALMALSNRLMNTCSRRLGTPRTWQGCRRKVRANFDILNLGLAIHKSQGLFYHTPGGPAASCFCPPRGAQNATGSQ